MTEKRMTFFGHLNELRNRLRVSAIVFIFVFFATFIFSNQLLNLLWSQFIGQYKAPEYHLELLANTVMSGFVTQLNLAFILAAAISMPLFICEIYLFVEPALDKRNKSVSMKIMLSSVGLFLAGVLFVYFVMLPLILSFFIQANTDLGVANFFSVDSFFSFIMVNLFIGGLIFQTPLVIVILNRLGVLPKAWLVKSRRMVYVLILLIAGIITPDASVISQLVLGGVMALLFEISMLLVK
jgi:sec-independent protein translocase protein TatC